MSVKSLLKTVKLAWLGQKEVEQGNDAPFELGSLVSSNGHWRERLPQDEFADVGGNEKRDA